MILVSEELAVEPGASNFVLSLRGSSQWHLPLVLLTRTGAVDSKFMRSNGLTESVPRPISLVTLRKYEDKSTPILLLPSSSLPS